MRGSCGRMHRPPRSPGHPDGNDRRRWKAGFRAVSKLRLMPVTFPLDPGKRRPPRGGDACTSSPDWQPRRPSCPDVRPPAVSPQTGGAVYRPAVRRLAEFPRRRVSSSPTVMPRAFCRRLATASLKRGVGTETDRAAIVFPAASWTGIAMHRQPMTYSSQSSPYPSSRICARAARSPFRVVIVRSVKPLRFQPSSRLSSSSGSSPARSTLPRPVA